MMPDILPILKQIMNVKYHTQLLATVVKMLVNVLLQKKREEKEKCCVVYGRVARLDLLHSIRSFQVQTC